MNKFELLDKHATAHYQYKGGPVNTEGKVIAYCEYPTVTIERADGSRLSWCEHLCTFEDVDSPEVLDKMVSSAASAMAEQMDREIMEPVQVLHTPPGSIIVFHTDFHATAAHQDYIRSQLPEYRVLFTHDTTITVLSQEPAHDPA